jgi:hypothetical protein
MPFIAIPAIDIKSPDKRANGRLYYEGFAKKERETMKKMILLEEYPAIFLRTKETTLGNGKSAFLAKIYWDLYNMKKNVLWCTALFNPRMRDLLSRILDAIVMQGKLANIRNILKPISPKTIEEVLSKGGQKLEPSVIHAIVQLLSASEHELAYVYSNIRRRIPAQNHVELFGAFLNLFYQVKEPRFTIFIDQFEIYVRSHRTMQQREELAHELNMLQRSIGNTTTLVVSVHSEAENILVTSAPEAETFTKIESSSVELPSFSEDVLIKLVECYLNESRPKDYNEDPLRPYETNVLRYSAHRTAMNPRDLMLALRETLLQCILEGSTTANGEFVSKYHQRIFSGLENKWQDFLSGKFSYPTV